MTSPSARWTPVSDIAPFEVALKWAFEDCAPVKIFRRTSSGDIISLTSPSNFTRTARTFFGPFGGTNELSAAGATTSMLVAVGVVPLGAAAMRTVAPLASSA